MATDAHALPAAVRADRRALTAIAAGHMSSDLCQGAVPALLPFLIRDRGLSYAGATALLLALTVSSSVIQPVLGHASDRMQGAWLMPAGVLVGGVGIALVGLTGSYAADALRRHRRRHRRRGLPPRGRALRPARGRLGGVDGHGPLLGRRERGLRRRPRRRDGRGGGVRAARNAPRRGHPGAHRAPALVGPSAARCRRSLCAGRRAGRRRGRGRRLGRLHGALGDGRRPHGRGVRPPGVRPDLVRPPPGHVGGSRERGAHAAPRGGGRRHADRRTAGRPVRRPPRHRRRHGRALPAGRPAPGRRRGGRVRALRCDRPRARRQLRDHGRPGPAHAAEPPRGGVGHRARASPSASAVPWRPASGSSPTMPA